MFNYRALSFCHLYRVSFSCSLCRKSDSSACIYIFEIETFDPRHIFSATRYVPMMEFLVSTINNDYNEPKFQSTVQVFTNSNIRYKSQSNLMLGYKMLEYRLLNSISATHHFKWLCKLLIIKYDTLSLKWWFSEKGNTTWVLLRETLKSRAKWGN